MNAPIKPGSRAATAVGTWLAILIALSFSQASACVWLGSAPHKVGDHFDIVVNGFAGPVPGIEIELNRYSESEHDSTVIARVKTDGAGSAHFENLRPGKYSLRTVLPLANDSVEVLVEKDKRKVLEERIYLLWPARKVLHLKRPQGTILSFWEPDEPSIALDGLKLTLLEGYSGREVETRLTASDGSFIFDTSTPGLYFIRVEEGLGKDVSRPWGRRVVHGEIAILFDPTDPAAVGPIRLQIAMSDCEHLMYTDKSRSEDPAKN